MVLVDLASPRAEALYNPLDVAEGMKIKDYVTPDILEMLHPVWHDFSPEDPIFYYVCALVYIFGGELSKPIMYLMPQFYSI